MIRLEHRGYGDELKLFKNIVHIEYHDKNIGYFTKSASFEIYGVKNNKFEVMITGKHIADGKTIKRFSKCESEFDSVIDFIISNSGCIDAFSFEKQNEISLEETFSDDRGPIKVGNKAYHGRLIYVQFLHFVTPKGDTFIRSDDIEKHKYFLFNVHGEGDTLITDFDKYMFCNVVNGHYVRSTREHNQLMKSDLDLLFTSIEDHK